MDARAQILEIMADHGADVIKVEPLNGGEPNRKIGPKRHGVSVYFSNTHRGKRSIQLNLKTKAHPKQTLDLKKLLVSK